MAELVDATDLKSVDLRLCEFDSRRGYQTQPTKMTFLPSSFRCPHCDKATPSSVLDSRIKTEYFRRRRVCGECKKRYTTYEINEKRFRLLLRAERYLSVVSDALDLPLALIDKRMKAGARLSDDRMAVTFKHHVSQESVNKEFRGKRVCSACNFYWGGKCELGIPEAGGTFADECASFSLGPVDDPSGEPLA